MFLEYEVVLAICVILVIALIFLFYVMFPYDEKLESFKLKEIWKKYPKKIGGSIK